MFDHGPRPIMVIANPSHCIFVTTSPKIYAEQSTMRMSFTRATIVKVSAESLFKAIAMETLRIKAHTELVKINIQCSCKCAKACTCSA